MLRGRFYRFRIYRTDEQLVKRMAEILMELKDKGVAITMPTDFDNSDGEIKPVPADPSPSDS